MTKTISVDEASRTFASLVRAVDGGDSYVITDGGRPVARILPVADAGSPKGDAHSAFLARLFAEEIRQIEPWTREELYER